MVVGDAYRSLLAHGHYPERTAGHEPVGGQRNVDSEGVAAGRQFIEHHLVNFSLRALLAVFERLEFGRVQHGGLTRIVIGDTGFEGITVGCGVLDTNPVPPYELLFVMARSLEIAPPIVLEVERAERRDLQVRRKGVDDFSLFHRSFLLLAKIRYHRPQTSAFSLGF